MREPVVSLLLLLVLGLAVLMGRRRPLAAALVAAAAYVVAVSFGGFDPNGNGPAIIGVGVAAGRLSYALGTSRSTTRSLVGITVLTAANEWPSPNPFPAMITVGLWLVGLAVRSHRSIGSALAERAVEIEAERELFAEESVRYERARIARDLHDLIAHGLSLIVVQANAGQRLPPGDDARAAVMLGNIDTAAREIRADVDGLDQLVTPPLTPSPVLSRASIEGEVIARLGSLERVDLQLDPGLEQIPHAVAAVLRRVLTEGLTNAAKHAVDAPVRIRLETHDGTRLSVSNAPPAHPVVVSVGTGFGLIGLTERALAVGGSVSAGFDPDGGWELLAEFPSSSRSFARSGP